MGLSRDTFYRYQTAVESGGVEALINANRRKPNLRNRVEEPTELAVTEFALEQHIAATAKLYTTKTPITAADLLNDRVLPFLAEQEMGLIRVLTDRGTEYCGKPETHGYQLYLALNDTGLSLNIPTSKLSIALRIS